MERWLFRRTENWVVLLVLTIVLISAVSFGGVVKTVAEGGRQDWVGTAAIRVAELPRRVADVFWSAPVASVREPRFEGRSGLVFPGAPPPPPPPPPPPAPARMEGTCCWRATTATGGSPSSN